MENLKNKSGNKETQAPLGARGGGGGGGGGGGVILQLLKEQSVKMEKLGTALKYIQVGLLKNNPHSVKMSVDEAAEVLCSLVNTHKHLIESRVEF